MSDQTGIEGNEVFQMTTMNKDPTNNDEESTRQSLELKIKELIETLFELSIMVYDFQPESNELIYKKINDLVQHYSSLDHMKDLLELQIPQEVVRYVEEGRNPDLCTREFVQQAAVQNQVTCGKIEAMKNFRNVLSEEMTRAFPEFADVLERER
ncbi:uncharacterized protein VTP21DRAFT_5951 [Calcarisporiella thermophila]|uniref:uncharacterized protein n=1 Tax=Calcarisporiella thermophila TaxID=911321 RepID=UPI0037425422